jgi:N-acetylglucosamine-6-phosphate deacetylase
VEGLRDHTPAVYALVGARIVPEPGKVIEKGTVVLRDGLIVAAGAEVQPPAEARVIDLSGKTIYPGLIDAFSEAPVAPERKSSAAPHWNPQITPQFDLSEHYQPDEELNKKLRAQGVTARLVAPSGGIIKGRSAVVTTGSAAGTRSILAADVALHVRLTVAFGSRENYPNSPMGSVALARQSFLDAEWYERAWSAYRGQPALPRPERNEALEALAPRLGGQKLVIFDAPNEQFFDRADRFAREFGLRAMIRGSGREYRRLEEVRASGRPVLVPVDFPSAPRVGTVEESLDVTLEELMHWDHAPENPARLAQAQVRFAFTTMGLRDQAKFLENVRRAVQRGLSAEEALRALTVTPAELLGVDSRLGSIAAGKIASLVVADGDLFARKTKIVETWVDGERFEMEPTLRLDPRGTWKLELADAQGRFLKATLKLRGTTKEQAGTIERDEPPDVSQKGEVKLENVRLSDARLTFSFEGRNFGHDGPARASGVLSQADGKLTLLGGVVWSDGGREQLKGELTQPLSDAEKKSQEAGARGQEPGTRAEESGERGEVSPPGGDKETDSEKDKKKDDKPETPALFPVNFPLGDYGRTKLPEAPKLLALTNATIWTCGPAGKLEGATLVIGDGKIIAVGKDAAIPDGASVIDAAGKHITPGIIDCHSHMATDGGVNESSQAITAEVRIGDFVDALDITIYRQLAGGVTSANVLHGSANPIGGQNQVIKLRWGMTGEQMKFAEAPPGIKFALGENVKQSNWGERFTSRYPQTRMGVEQIIRDAFHAARDYQRQHEKWAADKSGLPPRRDLELEALAEVVGKKRWIHCHSYRQDEILALIRVCDEFGITIGSLQHILEGYKVADAMARHGATGSSFSDWWAYKFEVIDAIPHNGALMHRQGIVVSFNSDDDELGRHLNHEAAKAIKYGGVPEEEALKFVTLNPARQLRIDQFVGSLEPGKHADFVVWSSSPLSTFSRCEQTWIDGRKFFDRQEDAAMRAEQTKMRAALIRKVLDSGQKPDDQRGRRDDESDLWPRHDEFCAHDEG